MLSRRAVPTHQSTVTRAMADAKHAAPHVKVLCSRRLSLRKAAIAFGYPRER
jgi:hypothetical protein